MAKVNFGVFVAFLKLKKKKIIKLFQSINYSILKTAFLKLKKFFEFDLVKLKVF